MAYLYTTCLPITQLRAVFYCTLISLVYVLSMYIGVPNLPRDFPSVVRARMRNAVLYTILIISLLYYDLYEYKNNCPTFLEMIGFNSFLIIPATLKPLFLSVVVYLGPIMQYTLEGTNILSISFWKEKTNILTLRAILVAPVTEEIVYRGCMFPLLYSAFGTTAILICPLLFGLAHLHHFCEWFKDEDNFTSFRVTMATLKMTIFEVFIHTCITFIFGIYSTFLFWRTSNIISPIVCHIFCNGIGPPPIHRISSTRGSSVIIFGYIAGLIMFIMLLFPLTNVYDT